MVQFIANDNLVISKAFINIVKIVICYFSFRYVIDHIKEFNMARIIVIISGIFFVLTVIAIVYKESYLFWRFNDNINKFSLVRLQLFYLEPSELGYHILLIMLPLVAIFVLSRIRKVKIVSGILLGVNAFTLYLAKPLGAIAIGFVAILAMTIYEYYLYPSKTKRKIYIILAVLFVVFVIILYFAENPIIMRIIYTLQGKDSSNNYRLGINFEVLFRSLTDYNFLGCGFGNLNTPAFIDRYRGIGLTAVVVNSFIYFIIETGVFGFIVVALLIINMLKKAIVDKSVFKLGLSVFIVIYSFVGGHFTSALTWVMYGIIFSNYNDKMLVSAFEKTLKCDR